MGRVTKVTYPTGHAVEYQYNNLGQLVRVPGYVDEKPTYDNGGILIGLKAANGVNTTWDYDKNGRLKELSYSNQGSLLKEYNIMYDGSNNIIKKNNDTFQYDLLNQLIYANLKGSFETDPHEEEQKVGKVLDDWLGKNPLELNLDQVDVTELDYARGSIGVDLLDTVFVTKVLLTPQNSEHRITSKGFISVYYGNDGVEYHKVEDWDLVVKEKGVLEIVFGKPLLARYLKVQCHFDERDVDFNPVNMSMFTNVSKDLIKIYYVTATRQEGYSYDKVGNRTSEVVTQRYPVNRNYVYYTNSSRLKSNGKYGFEYDANGNLSKKETLIGEKVTWVYGYDLLNRLIKVTKNGVNVAEYVYDESGLRVKKKGPESEIYYVFDTGGQMIYEQENGGYLEYVYVLGKHFARADGDLENGITKKYFYHTDHLGSTVLVTDELGEQVWSAEYSPFGLRNSVDGMLDHATQFTGKDLDEDSGLYYFNARWYDQEVGRFISEDPITDRVFNLYWYCNNNPIINIDPDGRAAERAEVQIWRDWVFRWSAINNFAIVSEHNLRSALIKNDSNFANNYELFKAGDTKVFGPEYQNAANLLSYSTSILAASDEVQTWIESEVTNGRKPTFEEVTNKANEIAKAKEDYNTNVVPLLYGAIGWAQMGTAGKPSLNNNVKLTEEETGSTNSKFIDVGKLNSKPLYRVMSEAELNAVKETGKLRGGWEGETYFTDSYYKNAKNAQNRLSLKDKPQYIIEFKITNNPKITGGARVEPAYGGTGGGREYVTIDPVEVEIVNYQKLK